MKKQSELMNAIETAIAVLLFVSMLLVCGKYIDIKINGKSASLPDIPEKDMHILMQTSSNENAFEKHTLAEPVCVGIKVRDTRLMAHTSLARQNLMDYARTLVTRCFSGESKKVEFESEQQMKNYLSQLCQSEDYLFFNFYGDIPAAAFLPALARDYEGKESNLDYNVQNLFLFSDNEQNLYALAVSSGKQVNILKPSENCVFNLAEYDAYNDVTGFAPFEYDNANVLLPVFSKSLEQNNYLIKYAHEIYGMDVDDWWIQNTLDVFGLNKSFSKTFVTKDNSLIDFVDDKIELLFSADGTVVYNGNEEGLEIYDLLSYQPTGSSYTFSDKTLAIKRLFNRLDSDIAGNEANLGITNVYYDESNAKLCFEMKYFVSGIAVTNNDFDAKVEVNDDSITRAEFYAINCISLEETTPLLPQKYSFYYNDSSNAVCHYRFLKPIEDKNGKHVVSFATLATTYKEGE